MTDQVTQNIIVGDSLHNVFEQWTHVENFPNFIKGVESVQKSGEDKAQWRVKGENGTAVSFTTEVTRLEKDQRIAWHTISGDIKTSGQVTFTPLPHNETEVTVTLLVAPAEEGGEQTAQNFMPNPGKQLMQILRNFKAYVEDMPERID